jgi:selenium-binding protein 1
MSDNSEPAHPTVVRILDFGPNSGPHYLRLTEDERRLVVSDYFLNEDPFGKVHAEGDHKVYVDRVEHNNLELDPRFELNFNMAFATGPARPHGVAFK